jgi:iron complex outermembrane receptor protein
MAKFFFVPRLNQSVQRKRENTLFHDYIFGTWAFVIFFRKKSNGNLDDRSLVGNTARSKRPQLPQVCQKETTLLRGFMAPWLCRYIGFIIVLAGFATGEMTLAAAEDTICTFDIPAGMADGSLRFFSEQAHAQFVFSADKVKGERLNALKGSYTPREALEHLVSGTGLCVVQDDTTGALTVDRRRLLATPIASTQPPNKPNVNKHNTLRHWMAALLLSTGSAQLPAQTSTADQVPVTTQKKPTDTTEEIVELSPFTVSTERGGRYQATEATSGTRMRISLLDSTQSVSVVTHDMIEDIGAGRISDAAKYVSGISESTIPNAQDRTMVRGFQSDGANIDGFNYFTYANTDPVLIERIEVVKGPNAILAPQGVPGGTINNVSKKPLFTDRGYVSGQIGRYDADRAEVDENHVLIDGKLALRFVGAEQRSENIAPGNYKNATTAMPMFTYRFSPSTELTVQAQFFNSWGGAYGGLPIDMNVGTNDKAKLLSGISSDLDLYTTMASRHSSGQYYRLLFTSVLTENLSMRLAVNDAYFSGSSVGISIGNANPTSNGLLVSVDPQTGNYVWTGASNNNPVFPRSGSTTFQTRRSYNVQNDYVYDLKFDAFKATTVAGWAVDYLKNPSYALLFTMPSLDIKNFTAQPYTYTGAYSSNQIAYSRAQQIYINETFSFFDDRLKINGGIARSEYKNYVNNLLGTGNGVTGIGTASNAPSATMPAAGIVFKPIKTVSLFAGVSRQSTALAPSTTSAIPAETQTSKQWEVGARAQLLDQRLYTSLTYFDIKQNNYSVPNPANAFVPTPVPLLPNLFSDRLAHGTEFEMTFVATKQLSLVGNATVMRNRDADGVPFRGIAEKSAALWINWTADKEGALKGLSAGIGADYLAKRAGDQPAANFTSLSTPSNIIRWQPSFYLPARTLVNASVSDIINSHWKTQLNSDNLLNEDYLAASTARNTVFPGTPFNPKIKVVYSF